MIVHDKLSKLVKQVKRMAELHYTRVHVVYMAFQTGQNYQNLSLAFIVKCSKVNVPDTARVQKYKGQKLIDFVQSQGPGWRAYVDDRPDQ